MIQWVFASLNQEPATALPSPGEGRDDSLYNFVSKFALASEDQLDCYLKRCVSDEETSNMLRFWYTRQKEFAALARIVSC